MRLGETSSSLRERQTKSWVWYEASSQCLERAEKSYVGRPQITRSPSEHLSAARLLLPGLQLVHKPYKQLTYSKRVSSTCCCHNCLQKESARKRKKERHRERVNSADTEGGKLGQKQDLAAGRGDVSSFSFSSSARLWNKKKEREKTHRRSVPENCFQAENTPRLVKGGNQRSSAQAAVCSMKSERRTCNRTHDQRHCKAFWGGRRRCSPGLSHIFSKNTKFFKLS